MFDGAYPPGVTGKMIDELEGFGRKEPDHVCNSCIYFDRWYEACNREWNNLDEIYYIPDRDDRNEDDTCDYWELDPDYEED